MNWTEQRARATPWVIWQDGLPYVGARRLVLPETAEEVLLSEYHHVSPSIGYLSWFALLSAITRAYIYQFPLLLSLPSIPTPSSPYTNRPLWVRTLLTSKRKEQKCNFLTFITFTRSILYIPHNYIYPTYPTYIHIPTHASKPHDRQVAVYYFAGGICTRSTTTLPRWLIS